MDEFPRDAPLPDAWMLGDWRVEPALNRVSRGDDQRLLEPLTMAVLVVLCRYRGQVVSSDLLIAEVWDDRPMGDNPVYKALAKLRRALDDDAAHPTLIVTVQKKGYRLVAPVSAATHHALPTPGPPGAELAAPKAGRQRRKLLTRTAQGAAVLLAAWGGSALWQADPAPGRLRSLSSSPGAHAQPSLAADGKRYAFISDADGTPHVWIQVIGERAPRQLTEGPLADQRPRWSPDGRVVLFDRGSSIWTVSADGGAAHELLREAAHANWSADGGRIVFERRYAIWTADAGGGRQRRLDGVPTRELPLAPRWPAFSPDGSRIVYFDAGTTPLGDLWIVDANGGLPRQITFEPAVGSAPVWSADGRTIVYSSKRAGSRTLWSVDVARRKSQPLLSGSGDDNFPDLSRDGRFVIYANGRERFSLMLTEPETGAERVLQGARLPMLHPRLSPDGHLVAYFAEVADGSFQLFTLPLAGGTPTARTADGRVMHALPHWAGNGRSLYFYRSDRSGGQARFSRLTLDDGSVQTVVDGWDWSNANGASVHPSRPRILYSRLIGQTPVQTLVRDLDDGTDRTLDASFEYPRWSRDGRFVAGSRHVDARFPGDIVVCRADGSVCRMVAQRARIPVWSRDDARLNFVRGFGVAQELFSAPADGSGSETRRMSMAPLYPLGPFYDVTDSGDVLWVRHERDPSTIWLADMPTD